MQRPRFTLHAKAKTRTHCVDLSYILITNSMPTDFTSTPNNNNSFAKNETGDIVIGKPDPETSIVRVHSTSVHQDIYLLFASPKDHNSQSPEIPRFFSRFFSQSSQTLERMRVWICYHSWTHRITRKWLPSIRYFGISFGPERWWPDYGTCVFTN